jgi:hypothetical protein
MTNAQMWWYMDELKRKRLHLESDRDRVKHWLNRAQDEPTKKRLTLELEDIEIQLAKVRRGLLH